MPPRRSHKKSRNGCDQCKERRVKCDEKRPICSNCTSRELTCTYLKIPIVSAPGRTAHAVTDRSPDPPHQGQSQLKNQNKQPISSVVSAEPSFVLRDLELMHKFSTDTFRCLCGDQSDMDDWQVLIPQQASKHTFLLHGILALASLHIAATATETTHVLSYLDTALQYYNMSFVPFRQALGALTPVNCDAVFAQSAIITVIGIALPRLNGQHRGECFSMIENMVSVFELLQGSTKVSRISRPWLKASMFSKYDFWMIETGDLDSEELVAIEKLSRLTTCIADAEHGSANREAIDLLRSCFAKFARSSHPVAILAWLVYTKKEFIDGLRMRQPVPLLILMHWGVLSNELGSHFWWAMGCGRDLVTELLAEIKSEDPVWEQALEWPRKMIGV
ncbi:Zn(2)-C6 fungal-type DNA-binding domain [Aspergillus oryzae]|uniref:Zn(2)-C6 fungal-type DNA-binding domain n=2 Tax=Aspergillus oryzae TaxID=5062 RepID=A0A1S9E182_ASPOZ|nr:Zn(2)-C6 fungal-type DNA-binding domain [Aspergillus oryzae]